MSKLCFPLATLLPLGGGEGSHGLDDWLDLGMGTQERQSLAEKSLTVFILEDWGRQGPREGGRCDDAVDLYWQGGILHYP